MTPKVTRNRSDRPADFAAVIARLDQLIDAVERLATRPDGADSPAPPSPYLNAVQVAELLSCSIRSVRTWAVTGEIPKPVKVGRLRLWLRGDIESHLRKGAKR